MPTIPFGKPIVGEEEKQAVLDVLNGPVLAHGPKLAEFEQRFAAFTGAAYAISVANCTAAMHLAYFAMGIGSGDEVVVPAQTHVATAHAVELTGAKPIFVDAELGTGNIDISQLEAAITPKTKAIAVVHFLGMPVNMDRINALAKKHSLFVLEDCALALGTRYKNIHAGRLGDVGCFSFYPVKHITTAEGGMVITDNPDLAEKIKRQRAFGLDKTHGERTIPGMYDVTMLGFNYRMNEIEAVLGIEQLKRLPGFLQKRRDNYLALSEGLRRLELIELFESTAGDYQSSYYCQAMMLKPPVAARRLEVIDYLNANGIGTSIYYPRPVPAMAYYQAKYAIPMDSFPMATAISDRSVALPVGPHIDGSAIAYMLSTIATALQKVTQ